LTAANYSRELADYIIYVIDVSGGDKIPRKGGPGITQSDLLIVNKVSHLEGLALELRPPATSDTGRCALILRSTWRRTWAHRWRS